MRERRPRVVRPPGAQASGAHAFRFSPGHAPAPHHPRRRPGRETPPHPQLAGPRPAPAAARGSPARRTPGRGAPARTCRRAAPLPGARAPAARRPAPGPRIPAPPASRRPPPRPRRGPPSARKARAGSGGRPLTSGPRPSCSGGAGRRRPRGDVTGPRAAHTLRRPGSLRPLARAAAARGSARPPRAAPRRRQEAEPPARSVAGPTAGGGPRARRPAAHWAGAADGQARGPATAGRGGGAGAPCAPRPRTRAPPARPAPGGALRSHCAEAGRPPPLPAAAPGRPSARAVRGSGRVRRPRPTSQPSLSSATLDTRLTSVRPVCKVGLVAPAALTCRDGRLGRGKGLCGPRRFTPATFCHHGRGLRRLCCSGQQG